MDIVLRNIDSNLMALRGKNYDKEVNGKLVPKFSILVIDDLETFREKTKMQIRSLNFLLALFHVKRLNDPNWFVKYLKEG